MDKTAHGRLARAAAAAKLYVHIYTFPKISITIQSRISIMRLFAQYGFARDKKKKKNNHVHNATPISDFDLQCMYISL